MSISTRFLSPEQERAWLLSKLSDHSAAFHEASGILLEGALDIARLDRALRSVAERHDVLRATLHETDGQPVANINSFAEVTLPIHDLSGEGDGAEVLARRLATEEAQRPFSLEGGPLWRVKLFRVTPDRHLLTLTMHRIVSDGDRTAAVFLRDLARAYEGLPSDAPPKASYFTHTEQRRAQMQEGELASQLAQLTARLRGAPPALDLATDRQRPAVQTFEAATLRRELPRAVSEGLRALRDQAGVPIFASVLAGFMALFCRYTGQEDIVVGAAASAPDSPDLSSLMGCLSEPVPVRADLSDNPALQALARRAAAAIKEAEAHRGLPFSLLVEALHLPRDLGRMPVFQVLFHEHPEPASIELPELLLRQVDIPVERSPYDLTVSLSADSSPLAYTIEYNRALFDGRVERLTEHLDRLFEGLLVDPEARVAEAPLLTDTEQRTLLVDWNDTAAEYPRDKCVHALFEEQVERTPDAVAVAAQGQQLTYRALNARANQIAHYLRSLGVAPGVRVGLCVNRSPRMVAALLGILKAGGAYVPLDPMYPAERLSLVLDDAQTPVLLTEARLAKTRPTRRARVVLLDNEGATIDAQSAENLVPLATSSDPAYVIYTSGSTGTPKGVQIPHRAVVNFLLSMQARPGLRSDDALLAVTTLSFDIAGLELYLPLITGARVFIANHATVMDGALLSSLIAASGATVMQATPATWRMLLDAGWKGALHLKILCGGEALPRALADQLLERCGSLWNLYGPTETTIWSTVEEVKRGPDISIGRPIANTTVYILDGHGQLVPPGTQGELHIGGDGLALGYLNRQELTAEKFIARPAPHRSGLSERLYKTGDLARFRHDGAIEYLGRIDNQVKIRGFRIECGDVEAALALHPMVRQTVVVARAEHADDKVLVAYVVKDTASATTTSELRAHLSERLPEYMVPSHIVFLESLPLTPNGKVDRRALPAPDQVRTEAVARVAPRNRIEASLVKLWKEVLSAPEIGIHDNFFDLGGHSLLAGKILARIRDRMGVDLPLYELFQAPTVAALAARVEDLRDETLVPSVPSIRSSGGGSEVPMSFAQRRLWFIDRLYPASTAYNCPSFLRLRGPLDIDALGQGLNAVIERHQALRTTFRVSNGEPLQVIHRSLRVSIDIVDLSGSQKPHAEAEAERLAADEARRPFDLTRAPLVRAKLFRLDAEDHYFFLNIHHIVTDGWSTSVLHREIGAFYQAAVSGGKASVPPLPIHYADYTISQREWMAAPDGPLTRQLAYWTERLKGAPPLLDLPTNRPRPAVASLRGATAHLTIGPELTAKLQTLSQEADTTLFMTLLTAFNVLLHRYTRQPDILVGVPAANRQLSEVEELIGLFVNTVVIRTDLSDKPSFRGLLARVREHVTRAYEHQDLPFDTLVEALRPQRALSHNPLVQVMVAPQEGVGHDLFLPGVSTEPAALDRETALLDLCLFIWEDSSCIKLSLEYSTDLFDRATIERMLGHLQTILTTFAKDPGASISSFSVLTEPEAQELAAWNATAGETFEGKCIHDLFEEQVRRTPDAVAVAFEGEALTYQELDARANQLAHALQSLGVKPDVLVGVCMERSLSLLITLLGIFKAGGAYVPLDPNYPRERVKFMVSDSAAPVVVTQEKFAFEWDTSGVSLLCVDRDAAAIGERSVMKPPCDAGSKNLAYLIYTSGSTGLPKGVAIEHRNAAAFIAWAHGQFTGAELANVLASTSICFDLSIFEIFVTLARGGTVTLVENVLRLLSLGGRSSVTLINTVPSAMTELLRAGAVPASVQTINLAGEPLTRDLADQVYQKTQTSRLLNLYGPSETTTYSTFAEVPRLAATAPLIGAPIANTTVFLLDGEMQLVPVFVPGEIYIGGAGVARGYLNRPVQTAERFLLDPHGAGPESRIYKTGDLARRLPDGSIEFLGRIDNQVKIRGFRIELGEVEAMLRNHSRVYEAVAMAREDQPGDKRLVAYVVADATDGALDVTLRSHLRRQLPEHSIPSHIVVLDALPLTPNGKVDRRALPAPGKASARRDSGFVGPSSRIEKELCALFKELLGVDDVDVEQNFFDLGAHSLLLLKAQTLIAQRMNRDLTVAELFRFTTIRQLARRLDPPQSIPASGPASTQRPGGTAPTLVPGASTMRPPAPARSTRRPPAGDASRPTSIAIIGMAGRFPGAPDVDTLWRNLCDGKEGITFFEPAHPPTNGQGAPSARHIWAQGLIDDVDGFDAAFFGYSPREAAWMDPQQRLFLQSSWSALEHAGYDPRAYQGAIGVFGGAGSPRYWLTRLAQTSPGSLQEYQALLGNGSDFLTTRVSYKLELTGPSLDVQTACSTSLVAVHVACQNLLNGECDMALAGGVSIFALDAIGYTYEPGGILSSDGHCRPFDADASGTVPASGVAAVVLKRLDDAIADGDTIYAVLRGTAINNDGGEKVGFTAPSVAGQSQVIRRALQRAGFSARDISYVEAHGTGTGLGDPVEVDALSLAFREDTEDRGFCGIGSLKSNLGHLDAAAGVAGLIKAALALYHGVIPPTLHYKRPNPRINIEDSPFFVVNELRPWPRTKKPRRAGVSAFGLGGTNAHAILEEPPPAPRQRSTRPAPQLLVLSARTETALEAATSRLADHLSLPGLMSLEDVAFTLQTGRREHRYRRSLVVSSFASAAGALRDPTSARVSTSARCDQEPRIAFMFPGVSVQYPGMGAELYARWPVFRENVDRCAQLFIDVLAVDIRKELYPEGDAHGSLSEGLTRPSRSMSTIFTVSYALARLLLSWGIKPDAMIGHSLGEYVAACLAGVLSLEDATALVATRGVLCDDLPEGAMLSVPLGEEPLRELLDDSLSISAINGPKRCVVSGPIEAIAGLEARLQERGITGRRLPVAAALHSVLVEPAMAPLAARAALTARSTPAIPIISNVTGTWLTPEEAMDPEYWSRHLRAPVRFADGLHTALLGDCDVLLEVGPGTTLTTLARQHPACSPEHRVIATMRHATKVDSDAEVLLSAVGRLWGAGSRLDWAQIQGEGARRRVPLPAYPFETVRSSVAPPKREGRAEDLAIQSTGPRPGEAALGEAPRVPKAQGNGLHADGEAPDQITTMLSRDWAELLGLTSADPKASFFELGGDSLLAIQLVSRLRTSFGVELSLHVVLEHPSIERLAAKIRALRPEAALSSGSAGDEPAAFTPVHVSLPNPLLIKLRDSAPGNAGKAPLFLVHPAGGTVFEYQGLLPFLQEERPVYGIRALGLEAGEPVCSTIPALAARYVEELLALYPEGPCFLGGHSSGGTLAYEMAQQLARAGREVLGVAMIDSVSVTFSRKAQIEEMKDLRRLFGAFERSAPDTYRRLVDGLEGSPRFGEYLLALNKALAVYEPEPLGIPILYLRAAERDETFDRRSEAFWICLAEAGFECHNVPGNHFTMIEPAYREAMARLLDQYVEAADTRAREIARIRGSRASSRAVMNMESAAGG